MKNIQNSYFRAILEVTSNGKFPEYSDLWRFYHPTSLMTDCDYCLFTESVRFLTTTKEEEKTGQIQEKILYVPVTRKVSAMDCRKPRKIPSKVSPVYRKNQLSVTRKVSLTVETKTQKFDEKELRELSAFLCNVSSVVRNSFQD